MSIRDDDPRERARRQFRTGLKRVVVASMAGTVVEWYEFFLYGHRGDPGVQQGVLRRAPVNLDAIIAAVRDVCGRVRRAPAGRCRVRALRRQVRAQEAAAVRHPAGGRRDLPDGLPADVRADRLLGAVAAGGVAVPAGLRGRRRVGRRGPAGGRAQPEPQAARSGPAGRRPRCPWATCSPPWCCWC